jgi:hypothetical protein
MNRQELEIEFRKIGGRMSYYNAAEGSYSREGVARGECRKAFKEKASQLLELGLTEEELKTIVNGCLVSSSDYL